VGPERDRHAPDLIRGRGFAVVAVCFALLAGCGEDDDLNGGAGSGLPAAGGAGTLAYALPELPRSLDPLRARSRAAQVITRQLHEPLVATLDAPYGSGTRQQGLALSLEPSSDRTVWRVQLRSRVRFQDGSPFNATAVQANARRWSAAAATRRLLPDLFAVDAPRPHEVRFQFERPLRNLRAALSSPLLGIVSPAALQRRGGTERLRPIAEGTGTGPFALREASGELILMTRSLAWWGTPMGLGPALDALEFSAVPVEAERLTQLEAGEVQAAEPLGAAAAPAVAADPLLRLLPGGVGLRASVRGLRPGGASAVPALSGVWLTTIGS
jgi:peptide/nickel transport system substrate-binding protein